MARSSRPSARSAKSLFALTTEFRLVELTSGDADRASDEIATLKRLVTSSQEMYPSIERWFDGKVVPGLKTSERLAYIAYESDQPVACAVLKRADRSKFCHVSVREDFQDRDIGQIFFTQMALRVSGMAREIHFTLPESLWAKREGFFASFGFSCAAKASRQYRRSDTELVCSAPISAVWSALVQKLPRIAAKFCMPSHSLHADMVMSVRPRYAERILAGDKRVEIRKSFSKRWVGSTVAIYASSPSCSLLGHATVRAAEAGRPDMIWAHFGDEAGCTRSEFDSYVGAADKVWAIVLENVAPYREAVRMDVVSQLLGHAPRPPQSYCGVTAEIDGWARSVSLAVLLQGAHKERNVAPTREDHSGRRVVPQGVDEAAT